jgi:hypothetical protein
MLTPGGLGLGARGWTIEIEIEIEIEIGIEIGIEKK